MFTCGKNSFKWASLLNLLIFMNNFISHFSLIFFGFQFSIWVMFFFRSLKHTSLLWKQFCIMKRVWWRLIVEWPKNFNEPHSRMDRIKNWFNIDKTFILTHTAETSFREAFVVETFRETHNFQILKWIHFRMQGSCIIEWTFFGV